MSEFSAKTIRAARKAKASRLGTADPHTKVDSSDWTPAEPLNADVKTGARPLSRRAFKKGGKVVGEKAKANMGRKPRCGGGKAGESWVNRNVKEANEEREGKKHVGGFKKGGRAKREEGGNVPLPPRRSDYFPNEGKEPEAKDLYSKEDLKRLEAGRKAGGRTKKMGGGGMMGPALDMLNPMGAGAPAPAAMPVQQGPDPRLGMVSPTRMKFAGAQGTPYKKGGKVAHGDEAMDKALIKKMVKPSARTGKADGGMKTLGAGRPGSKEKESAEKEYGEREDSMKRAENRIANEFSGWKWRDMRKGVADARSKNKDMQDFVKRAKDREEKESMKDAGYKKGGRAGRATGGRTKGKGKTNINIIISAGKKPDDGGMGMPPGMPPGGPGGPMSLQKPPPGMPGLPPGMPPGMPAGGPPGMGQPPMPPMARKSGGRITKVARSYKDMEAGAASGEGRLQKTDIAKRIPKKREDGVIETDKRGYPNKVIGATGGRTAHKAGGKVYRSYKDMDAGAGSGMGRLEKEEIQKRKH